MNHLGATQDTNKCVLITASSKGLGKAIAREFAFHGYQIILHGRNEKKLHDFKFEINSQVVDGMKPMQVYESIETNLLSPIRLTQKIYPLLKEQRHGSIININSIVGKEPKKYRSVHSATKWGLKGFTKSLRIEAEDYNVKLINVYPSQIKTVKEHTFGLEPYDVAKQIYNEHQTGKDWDELIIDGRPEEFRP